MVKKDSKIIIKQTGRRKSANARVELTHGDGKFTINNILSTKYLQDNSHLIGKVQSPFTEFDEKEKYNLCVKVNGGGLVAQAEAIKLGISRALSELDNPMYRSKLKAKGYLTRDSRVKERKKYGLKKARKAPQFSKR